MMKTGIVRNQKVKKLKIQYSKNLRKKMTRAESVFWNIVRNRKFLNLKFRRQQIIDGFIVDFFCREKDLVVEIDGSIHETIEQKAYDEERTKILQRRGLTIIRIKNEELLKNQESTLEKLKQSIPHF